MADGPIVRTLRVLEALCLHGPQSLSELADRLELGAPTTLRFLRLMAGEGFVRQNDDRQWAATLTMWRLGAAVIEQGGWATAMNAQLQLACDELGETVVYASYEDGATVYLGSAEPRRDLRTHVALGRSQPASRTVTGRCVLAHLEPDALEATMAELWGKDWAGKKRKEFLAELDAIRADGFAVGGSATWGDLWGAAVPVRTSSGVVRGAVGTVMVQGRQPDDAAPVIDALRRAASQLVAF